MNNTCISGVNPSMKDVLSFLKAIGDENRFRVLCMLQKDVRCVCEIWPQLGLPQNLISHHLNVLKKTGLVKAKKEGLRVFYTLDKQVLKKYFTLLHTFFPYGT